MPALLDARERKESHESDWATTRRRPELWLDNITRSLLTGGTLSLCAQSEAPPLYRYVSVEGPVTSVRPTRLEEDLRPMAHRYFGPALGDRYVESSGDEGSLVFTMRPERWRTVDYGKHPQRP
jgi:hypothetical protein